MNIDIKKLFNEFLDVTTIDNKTYHIINKKIYINDSSYYYGKKYVVTSNELNTKNLYILKEIYSLEDNRLRYLYTKYTNVNLIKTIETDLKGNESSILVLDDYTSKKELIGSIGNIKYINSDKIERINENKRKKDIFKLILKPTTKKEVIKKAA